MTECVAPRVAAPRVAAPPIECPEHAVTRGGDTAFLGHSTALAGEAAPDATQCRTVRCATGWRVAGRCVRAGVP